MKWEEYNPEPVQEIISKQTDIECPKCGYKIMKRMNILLTCYPPKHQYECRKCGWVGYNY